MLLVFQKNNHCHSRHLTLLMYLIVPIMIQSCAVRKVGLSVGLMLDPDFRLRVSFSLDFVQYYQLQRHLYRSLSPSSALTKRLLPLLSSQFSILPRWSRAFEPVLVEQ